MSKSFINELFEMKADTLYALRDKEEIENLKASNDILKDIYNTLDNIKHQELKDKINTLIDNIDVDHSHREKNIYKSGFTDAVKMMIEVTKS